MKRSCFIIILSCGFVATAYAEQFSIPTDGGKWYFTTAGDVGDIVTGPVVDELKAKTHYRYIHSEDPIWPRYAGYVGELPAIWIQKPDGKVVFKLSGDNFPRTTGELNRQLLRCLPRPRPEPEPTPVPTPLPGPTPVPSPVPDVVPEPVPDVVPEDEGLNTLLMILAGLLGGSGAIVPDLMKGKN